MQSRTPRVLEIGAWTYCKDEYPETTTLLWTGERPLDPGHGAIDCTPARFIDAMRDVRAGKYDAVIVYIQTRAAWHPRYWLRSLVKDPLRPFSAVLRVFGVALLRFVKPRIPMAVLDMNDGFIIGRHNFFLLDKADIVFKRELPADRWHMLCHSVHPSLPTRRIRRDKSWIRRLEKIHPIALPAAAVHHANLWDGDFPEKTADIFFSGDVEENSWVRRTGMIELEKLRSIGLKVDIPQERLPYDEFLRRMSKAWLAWSPEGFSWECYRTAEAAQCLTVPVINYPTVERYKPLRQDEHVVFYDLEPGGLARAVQAALADKDLLRKMAIAARDHVRANHLHRPVIDYIVSATLAAATGGIGYFAKPANSLTTRS